MATIFIREQKRYTFDDLMKKFQLDETNAIKLLDKLKRYGVLKTVLMTKEELDLTDLQNEQMEIFDDVLSGDKYFYVFVFVGVLVIESNILIVYPKYIHTREAPISEIKQIMKVLGKYNSREQTVKMYHDVSGENTFNLLALILYIINDYHENGIYSNEYEVYEINGYGEINWNRTIDASFPYLSNNRPIYAELVTRKKEIDEENYFKRLHEYVVTASYSKLKQFKLADIFEVEPIDLSSAELSDFGEVEDVLERLEKELHVQFNTRKQVLLKTLYSFIEKNGSSEEVDTISLYGTNSFNLVWEKVCATVLNNQLNKQLKELPIYPTGLNFDGSKSLLSIIEKPKWVERPDESDMWLEAKETLKPDIVTMTYDVQTEEGIFYIFDAKYYDLNLSYENRTLKGYPGIDSIDKQYLYQLAYKDFIECDNFSKVVNCFLLPTEEDSVINKGIVYLPMMRKLGLEDIAVRQIPAKQVFDLYLKNKMFLLDELKI